jgi:hypothetical protein
MTMERRRGEKIGWIGGWLGGFVWVLLLSVLLLVQGRVLEGLVGLPILALAVGAILLSAPWRHPDTPYWKLLAPIYGVLVAALAWGGWLVEDLGALGLGRWALLLAVPVLLPFATIGGKRWRDGGAEGE